MKNKKLYFITIAIATIIVLYFSLKDDYSVILSTIFNINKIWLLAAFILLFMYYFIKSIVIYNLTLKFNKKYSVKQAFRLTLETNFFHAVTPFSTGGQPYEIYSLKKNGLKISDAANISIANFIAYQIALVLLGVVAIISNHLFGILNSSFLKLFLTLGFIINFLVIVILFMITLSNKSGQIIVKVIVKMLSKFKKNNHVEDKINNYLLEFHDGTKLLLKDKKNFIYLVSLQFTSLICLYLVPLALIHGIQIYSINSFESIVAMAYVMLMGSFIPIPGGSGGIEYSFIVFFQTFITGSKLNAIMLLWRFITYYFGMILGALILNLKKEDKK